MIISKKVTKKLDVEHTQNKPEDDMVAFPIMGPNTGDYKDYSLSFYMSQGDFNSKDYVPVYNRKMSNLSLLLMIGVDSYKRGELYLIENANRWLGRRNLFHMNFFFPLFWTKYETWFALLYAEMEKDSYKEFIYEILKRSEPKLLEIPFTGDPLPQTGLEPYLTVFDSKHHEKEPFLWDYKLVKKNLKPVLKKNLNKSLGIKSRIIFKIAKLNELDYFLNPKLDNIMESYLKNKIDIQKCIKMLLKEGKSVNYLKTKAMIKMTKKNRFPYNSKLQTLMDYASVANKRSFEELENDLGIKME